MLLEYFGIDFNYSVIVALVIELIIVLCLYYLIIIRKQGFKQGL